MNSTAIIWICMAIGSTLGGCVPLLWGASFLSLSSIVWSSIGALAGIYFGYKIGW